MRLEKMLGVVLSAAGVACLVEGILSVSRLMDIFLPKTEEATNSQLASFFYVSTPQTILWSVAFVTFFASGIFLVTRSYGSEEEMDELSKALRVNLDPDAALDRQEPKEQVISEADDRVLTIKAEVLKAIEKLEKLDTSTD